MKEGISTEKLIVPKTANIYTLGQLDKNTKSIWIVFHGYGQSAEHFLEKFRDLEDTFVIAPEANNHFYLKGTNGRIGANWMTSYERDDAITDYVNYINLIVEKFKLGSFENSTITLFGFSQGVATLCRWFNQSFLSVGQLILWGSLIPDELEESEKFNLAKVYCVFGETDEYILENQTTFNRKLSIYKQTNRTILTYKGGHIIHKSSLKEFYKDYWK